MRDITYMIDRLESLKLDSGLCHASGQGGGGVKGPSPFKKIKNKKGHLLKSSEHNIHISNMKKLIFIIFLI